jgi:hypothetical protein
MYKGDSLFGSFTSKTASHVGIEFNRTGSGAMDWRIADMIGGNLVFSYSNSEFGEGAVATKFDILKLNNVTLYPAADNSMAFGSPSYRWTTIYATNGTINTSDARDKTDIKDLKYGINEVMKLRPVSFNWKARPQDGAKLGFIAQEVEPILNEVVKKEYLYDVVEGKKVMKDEYKYGIYYSDIIPVLTKAIQEQQTIIEDLQNQVKALNEKVDKLTK